MSINQSLVGRETHTYVPGTEISQLFLPLSPEPMTDTKHQRRMQELVLSQPWCTANMLRLYFTRLCLAATHDIFKDFNIELEAGTWNLLDNLIDKCGHPLSKFEATGLDGCRIRIAFDGLRYAQVCVQYKGPNQRLDHNLYPNLNIRPVRVLTVPEDCLCGSSWTDERIHRLRLLCSASISEKHLSKGALYEGVRIAIQDGNYAALLVLIWILDCMADFSSQLSKKEKSPHIPAGIFQLAAQRPLNDEIAIALSVKMFKCLLRAHAEDMPKSDSIIGNWASRLLTHPASSEFAQWTLDFSARDVEDETISGWGPVRKTRSMFDDGRYRILDVESREDILRRYVKIDGSELSFRHEILIISRY